MEREREKKNKENQIISQRRIELREDRRSEWVRKEKEIMKQHKGSRRDKVTQSKGEKERAQRKHEGIREDRLDE